MCVGASVGVYKYAAAAGCWLLLMEVLCECMWSPVVIAFCMLCDLPNLQFLTNVSNEMLILQFPVFLCEYVVT